MAYIDEKSTKVIAKLLMARDITTKTELEKTLDVEISDTLKTARDYTDDQVLVMEKKLMEILQNINNNFEDGTAKKAIADQNGNVIDVTYASIDNLDELRELISALNGLFTNGMVKKAIADKDGNDISTTYIKSIQKGAANGIAPLDRNRKIDIQYLPSYVDDVVEYENRNSFPDSGESGKIYVDLSDNTTWRWSGSEYVQIKGDLVIGTTAGTAFDGKKGDDLEHDMSIAKATISNIPFTYVPINSNNGNSGITKVDAAIRNDGGKVEISAVNSGGTAHTALEISTSGATVNGNNILTEANAITEEELNQILSEIGLV